MGYIGIHVHIKIRNRRFALPSTMKVHSLILQIV